MPFDEADVPDEVRDILARLPRPMRQRVLADYESHYAPFLMLLAGWKQAVQAHYALGREAALARLEEQFFPLGEWRFPPQALAVPQRPPERMTEIPFEARFAGPADQQPWMSCGPAWLQPTILGDVSLRPKNERAAEIALDVEQVGGAPAQALLARGQLAFVAAPDEVVAALARGRWWVQTAGGDLRPAVCVRYDGSLLFEREMQSARVSQRQLDLWLPPCHPYSRKMVCWRLATDEEARALLGHEPPPIALLGGGNAAFRFVGDLFELAPAAGAFLRRQSAASLFHLNALPVVQTAMSDNLFYAPFPRVGSEYALRITGLPNLFAAVAYNDGIAVPATMQRVPSNDPRAKEDDVEVRFAQTAQAKMARVKLYHGSHGQFGEDAAPTLLERPPVRFSVPFPPLGGAVVGGPENRAEWVRTAWYHGVLRPALLTEGDLAEILRQRSVGAPGTGQPGSLLRFRRAAREIVHQPDDNGAHWRSYLWPSLVVREDRFGDGPPDDVFSPSEDYVPLVQRLRLSFERAPGGESVPEFLLADVANYLASVLSQYFIVSCFRIEGRVESP